MEGIRKYMLLVMSLSLILILMGGEVRAGEMPAKVKDLINKVCAKTAWKEACAKRLLNVPGGYNADASVKDLAFIFLKAAADDATEILGELNILIEDEKLEAEVQQGLSDCKDSLLDAEDQIEDTMVAMISNTKNDAKKWLQAAVDASLTCEQSLKGVDNVFLQKNAAFRQLCNIALAVVDQMNIPA